MKVLQWTIILLMGIHYSNAQTSDQKLVMDYLAAAFDKDYERQRTYMHEEIIDHHPTILAEPARGREELIQGWKQTVEPMDSTRYNRLGNGLVSFEEGELQGNWVLDISMVDVRFTGAAQWVKMLMVGIYRITDGRIIEVRNYGNLLDLYQQLGFKLVPPGN